MDAAAKKAPLETPLVEAHRAAGACIDEWFGCSLPSSFGDWRTEYQFARETVALLDKNYRAYLGFTGPDRVRYLNAILTNNIKDLNPGEGITSLFLNPQGRIQAEIETYAETEKLFCVSFAMIREKLISALDHYIIMDDVAMTDESTKFCTLGLEGPRTAEIVRQASGIDLKNLNELSWADGNVGGIPCRIVRRSFAGNPNAEFLCGQGHLSELWNILREGATTYGGGPVGYRALNALRLEAGVPWFGYDFGEKQIPHEAGLEHSHISYTKGCYTGQEIVERVRSRGQVNRVRALFRLSMSELPVAEEPIMFDGKEVGHITRAAYSPAFQSNMAMGYVRREQSAPGSTVRVGEGTATAVAPRS